VADVRHPLDPDPVRSTKATAVLVLGAVGAATGVVLGGVVPATLALVLAGQARTDLRAADGFLLGGRRIRTGVALSWIGIVLAIAAVVVMSIVGLLSLAGGSGGHDFAPGVN